MIDGMLESAEETHHSLQKARAGSLDDYTVGRVREVYTTQRDDLWLYEDQLARWRNGELTSTQKQEWSDYKDISPGCAASSRRYWRVLRSRRN